MNFQELIKERYSCRKLSERKVDDALVEQLIEAANLAPTAVNRQPFKIFWMKSEAAKEAVRATTRYTFGADTFLVVGYRESEGWTRSFDNHSFAETDAAIAATHLMLAITDLGLATTWVGYFDAPRLQTLCPEMAGYELIALFPVGYAAEDAEPSSRHAVRKQRGEMVEEL